MLGINVNEVLEQASQTQAPDFPVSAGRKLVRIVGGATKEFQKATSSGTGVKLEFSVILPAEEKGKSFNIWYNATHSNEMAQRIGREELSKCASACNVYLLNQVEDLIGSDLVVEVKQVPATDRYAFNTLKITKYEKYNVAKAVAQDIKKETGQKLGIVSDAIPEVIPGSSASVAKEPHQLDDDIPF